MPVRKGNHDSDFELEMREMRQNANQILENHGVDLVLSAHSNSYERSYFIDGHYGLSSTFVPSMLKNGGDGRTDGNGAYTKAAGANHAGAVYMTLGSSSGVNTGNGQLDHPAMYTSLAQAGSAVVDVSCTRMDVKFLGNGGAIQDYFQIHQTDILPSISITSPPNNSTFPAGSDITITANATDPDTHIRRVRFLRNGTWFGTDYEAPYSVTWNNAAKGNYALTAIVEEDLCGNKTSSPINVTIQ